MIFTCTFFSFIFVYILVQAKSVNNMYTYILVQTQLQMHLRRILFFGILMFTYLKLSFISRLFSRLRHCIKKLIPCLVIKTIFLCQVHLKTDRTSSVIPRHMLSLPSKPTNSATLHCALYSFSLSHLNDISTCLLPSLRKSFESPASRRLFLLLLKTSVVPVMPLLSIL